jgi:hypothetical protein
MSIAAADRICRLLTDISYKQDWRFKVVPIYNSEGHPCDRVAVHICYRQRSVEEPETFAEFSRFPSLPTDYFDHMTDDQIVDWLFRITEETEMHEVREWFKYRGCHVRDPHPELHETNGPKI